MLNQYLGEILLMATPKTITKANIVEEVHEQFSEFSKKETAEIIETIFETMKENLEKGEKLKLSGFGNFVIRDKRNRLGRNPQTGDRLTITARRVSTFRPSQRLKAALNR